MALAERDVRLALGRPNVNSTQGAETRPSLSWDGTALYLGSTRPGGEGMSDHYLTTREP